MLTEQTSLIAKKEKRDLKPSSHRRNSKCIRPEYSIIPSWAIDEYKKISKQFDENFKRINGGNKNV